MTTKLSRITNLILALLLAASFGDVEAADFKQTLIKVDKQLNDIYTGVIKKLSDKDKKILRQKQRDWIKKRNIVCGTGHIKEKGEKWLHTVAKNKAQTECVPRLTQRRVTVLKAYSQIKTQKKYPPYPEVWGYVLSYPSKTSRYNALDPYKMDNGEILFTYIKKRHINVARKDILKIPCDKKKQYAFLNYFNGKVQNISCSEYERFANNNKEKLLSPFNEKNPNKIPVFNDGSKVVMDNVRNAGGNCYFPFFYFLSIVNKEGKVIASKTIIRVTNQEQYIYLNPRCGDGDNRITTKIREYKDIYMIGFDDDSFLLYSKGDNFIIRFDKNLKTRFPIRKHGIYLIDTNLIDRFREQSEKQTDINSFQYIHNKIAAHIKSIKRRK